MNIEFTRPVKIVTTVAQSTHSNYYEDEPYAIFYRDEDSAITLNKTQGLDVHLPTDLESDTHSIQFTLPNLEVNGSGSLEVYCGGDIQNTVDINIVPITGETTPIEINL